MTTVNAHPAATSSAAELWRMPRAANRTTLPGNAAFMLADWGDQAPEFTPENPVVAYAVERRARLSQALPSELLIIPCGANRECALTTPATASGRAPTMSG
jgi:hypothetical protein